MSESKTASQAVHLSSVKFVAGCAAVAALLVLAGHRYPFPPMLIAAEVLTTVVALFLFGSFRYRIDKNALTYGSVMIVSATFWTWWWPDSGLRADMASEGVPALARFVRHHFLSFSGLEHLVHLDTMLFILGLTFFVAVISQTRILESLSFIVLAKARGSLLVTIGTITAVVSFASGILDGVSMIGLLIRVMVILLFLCKVADAEVIFFTIMATMVTTICGMWLAYGEPPNLIMKTNLHPRLTDGFFLRYCLPVAAASYLVLFFNMRRRLKGRRVDLASIDFFELHTADVRFLQVMRHGETITDIEFVESRETELGRWHQPVLRKLHEGVSLAAALIEAGVEPELRHRMMALYLSEDLAGDAEAYLASVADPSTPVPPARGRLFAAFENVRRLRIATQKIGALSFIPFVALLVLHAVNHDVPLFLASFAGFGVAFLALLKYPKMRSLALREARHEYSEYLFLFPLFFSIALLTKTGFFNVLAEVMHAGIEAVGASVVAWIQFSGATVLSAILDNNVVADFASRALHGLPDPLLHLFAMSQIAGYALGGCWTHIGSAQSVVAYSFIQKDVDSRFTPVSWIRTVTPIVAQIFVVATALIFLEGQLMNVLH